MPSFTPLILQLGVLLALLFFIGQIPKFDSSAYTFSSSLVRHGAEFDLKHKGQSSIPSTQPHEDTPTTNNGGDSLKSHEKDPEDALLKTFPESHGNKTAPFNRRQDQKREHICKITGQRCLRYTPTEELPYFWMVMALYTPDQKATELLYQLHTNYINYAKLYGFKTQVIEVIFPGQEYKVTRPNNEPYELQYKADWIFNMRENLVNVGSKKLPDDWEYIAWIDAHIFFDENRYWFEDVVVELHKYNAVHMLSSNDFFNADNRTVFHEPGVAQLWQERQTTILPPIRQCGMAWATRRDVFEKMNGLLDICIGTKCDLYTNYAMFGEVFTGECENAEYAEAVAEWQMNAIKAFDKKIGYVRGNIIHFAHCQTGCRTSSYDQMTGALSLYDFNPNTDMERDEEGRLQFKANFGLAHELWEIYGGRPKW